MKKRLKVQRKNWLRKRQSKKKQDKKKKRMNIEQKGEKIQFTTGRKRVIVKCKKWSNNAYKVKSKSWQF